MVCTNKPVVAAERQIASARVAPARDVAFVLVGNTKREAINLNAAGFGEVKCIRGSHSKIVLSSIGLK